MRAIVTLRRAAGVLQASDPDTFGLLNAALRLAAMHLEDGDPDAAGEAFARVVVRMDQAAEPRSQDERRAVVEAIARLVLCGATVEVAQRTVASTRGLPSIEVQALWAEAGAEAAVRVARMGGR